MKTKRDYRIDVLRALAILLIMLAHANPMNVIYNLRNCDVVMMVIISGSSFALSTSGQIGSKRDYWGYIVKRFKRLVIPAWVFITMFLVVFYIIFALEGKHNPLGFSKILSSYGLIDGIGYVWIIRVLFFISILNPWFKAVNEKFTRLSSFILLIIGLLLIQWGLVKVSAHLTGFTGGLVKVFFEEITGYSIVGLIGIRAIKENPKNLLKLGAIFFVMIVAYPIAKTLFSGGFNVNFINFELYKYPPHPYYLLYGTVVTMVLLAVLAKIKFNDRLNNVITWISKNSLSIYYWHIFPVEFFIHYFPNKFLASHWVVAYIFIVAFAVVLTLLQNKFLPNLFSDRFKRRQA